MRQQLCAAATAASLQAQAHRLHHLVPPECHGWTKKSKTKTRRTPCPAPRSTSHRALLPVRLSQAPRPVQACCRPVLLFRNMYCSRRWCSCAERGFMPHCPGPCQHWQHGCAAICLLFCRQDPGMQALSASAPLISAWDDHGEGKVQQTPPSPTVCTVPGQGACILQLLQASAHP